MEGEIISKKIIENWFTLQETIWNLSDDQFRC